MAGEEEGGKQERVAGHRMVEIIREVSLTAHTAPPPRPSARARLQRPARRLQTDPRAAWWSEQEFPFTCSVSGGSRSLVPVMCVVPSVCPGL